MVKNGHTGYINCWVSSGSQHQTPSTVHEFSVLYQCRHWKTPRCHGQNPLLRMPMRFQLRLSINRYISGNQTWLAVTSMISYWKLHLCIGKLPGSVWWHRRFLFNIELYLCYILMVCSSPWYSFIPKILHGYIWYSFIIYIYDIHWYSHIISAFSWHDQPLVHKTSVTFAAWLVIFQSVGIFKMRQVSVWWCIALVCHTSGLFGTVTFAHSVYLYIYNSICIYMDVGQNGRPRGPQMLV